MAIQAQSIEDVNSGIIRQLERSDYYVFIDFGRESLSWLRRESRGSLFTHQELAIAHRTGFEHVLFFQEDGVKLEGLLRYMGANPTSFGKSQDLVPPVRRAMRERGWRTGYSRHLIAIRPRWEQAIITTGRLTGRFFYVDIENRRHDVAAFDVIARLEFIRPPDGQVVPSPNRSPLKLTGQGGFSQVIWPASHGAFDVLMISVAPQHNVFLHNALDLATTPPLLTHPGRYELEYAVLARDFPVLRFTVEVEFTGDLQTTDAKLLVDEN